MPRDGSKYSARWVGRACARECNGCVCATLPALRGRGRPPPQAVPRRPHCARRWGAGRVFLTLGAPEHTATASLAAAALQTQGRRGAHGRGQRAAREERPCTARVTTSGFGGGEKPRSPLCVHREGGAGCRVRDSSASRVLVSRYKGKGNTATGVSAPARKRRLSGLVFPRSPKAEPASAQRAELRNASPSLSRPQQLN